MSETCSQNVKDEQDLLLSTAWRTREVAVIFDWLEKWYSDLFGRGKGKATKHLRMMYGNSLWKQSMQFFKGRNKRTRESFYTKIDNMKNQGALKN